MVIQSSIFWRSWYIKYVSSEMKILSGCLICTELDRFESSEDESCGDVFSDEYDELVEVDDISQFGFLEAP